jgi:hypothetical protein
MGATSRWVAKAKQAAASLKAEYEAGKRGDDTPPEPIWPSPRQQLDALLALWTSKPAPPDEAEEGEADAEEVASAMRGIDWASVRAATSERTGEAARVMRSAAEHVDWAKVQPVAAQVSSALIAAVASGRLPVGGRLGSTVARTIIDQGGLAQRVALQLRDEPTAMPPDFRRAIETTATES